MRKGSIYFLSPTSDYFFEDFLPSEDGAELLEASVDLPGRLSAERPSEEILPMVVTLDFALALPLLSLRMLLPCFPIIVTLILS
jgi:hypothetical protein